MKTVIESNGRVLKIGDKVTHKLSGQGMTIEKIRGEVATCVLDVPESYKLMRDDCEMEKAICHLENLELK